MIRTGTVFAAAVTLTLGTLAATTAASAQQTSAAMKAPAAHLQHVKGHLHPVPGQDYARACAAAKANHFACLSLVRTDVKSHLQSGIHPDAAPVGFGYGEPSLDSAYALPSGSAGSGQTVAVVDAFNDPNAVSDLATYRSSWSLPACGTGCFSVVNQNGATSPLPANAGTNGWDVEESLDVDMVSAICPLCHIILVEASNATDADLGAAVNSAVNLGAKYVSNSYGGGESSTDTTLDSEFYNHPGVAVTASAGDSGFGVEYPAASQFVTAVGGTNLTTASNSRGWTEKVWNTSSSEGTGSGCSTVDPKPSWQKDTGCAKRTNNDTSAVADPATGLAVYDTYSQGGWLEVGGTSASSPIIASVFALAGTPAAGTYPSSYMYSHTSNLFDVTTGSDGSCGGTYLCTAEVGYDGPTGLGTPDGTAAFTNGTTTGNTVTVTNPGNQTGTVGTAVSLQIHASDSASGQTLTYSANGLPAGLSISSSGLITGTPTTAATYNPTVTATDTTGAHGSASFTWTISTSGGGCTAAQLLGNPGFETGSAAPWTTTAGVINPNGAGETSHSGTWYAWLDGYGTT
ncbi:MAG TPA: putative Ig domain-containing protein, partial [Streptosporangiaceae bacterium]